MRTWPAITFLSIAALSFYATKGSQQFSDPWSAKWIAAGPAGTPGGVHMPLFRCSFNVPSAITHAVLRISGLGQYEPSINGQKVGGAVLAPGWTNYRKTVLTDSYDVTAILRPGENAIGVMLGNGMFNVPKVPGRYTKFVGSFGQPMLIAELTISLGDGTTRTISSDRTWKTALGPIVFSHPYGGEDFDARLETAGWNEPGFDDSHWSPANEIPGPGGILKPESSPEIRVHETFKPVAITSPEPGIRIYDLGQNFSGWPKISVRGPAAASVKLIPGELLNEKGYVSQQSSKGPEWFTYTLKGAGEETWAPRFSYWGFRYLQVEAPPDVSVHSVEGQFIYASAPVVGTFSCSKDLFNRIHKLIDMAILSNMQSVLTDCPHREKLGWLEQTHLLGSSVMYNFDVDRLYAKMADDIADAQLEDGLIPEIAPEYVVFPPPFRDSPEWASAVVLSAWASYTHFGNRTLLADHYETMRRYVDYLGAKAQDGILSYGLGDWYDIGPKPPGVSQLTSLGVTATAIYFQDLTTLAKIASILDKPDDAKQWAARAEQIAHTFNAKYWNGQTGLYDRGSQTDFAMPLAVGLVPEERKAAVLNALVYAIRESGNHTTAGDVGFHYVIQALSEGGRSDVIYDLLSNPDPPSYAAQLAKGETTLAEAWDADP